MNRAMAVLAVGFLGISFGPVVSASPITLVVPTGGSASTSVDLTFGNSYGFDFQFTGLAGSGQLQITSNVVGNVCCGPSISADIFNYAPDVWHTVSVLSPLLPGDFSTLSFVAETYGSGRSGTVLIQNIRVDGVVVAAAAVPEPGTLALLGLGLLGLGLTRRKAA